MSRLITAFVALTILSAPAAPALAADYKAGSLEISQPWSRATPKGAAVAGGFMTITNKGSAPDRLIGGSSPVAGRLEVHEMSMDQGVMKMRQLKNGLEIKPGESVELKPGSYHVMLLELKRPLQAGERFKGTLTFEKAGAVDVEYVTEALGATGSSTHKMH